jgi:hypothetical protein
MTSETTGIRAWNKFLRKRARACEPLDLRVQVDRYVEWCVANDRPVHLYAPAGPRSGTSLAAKARRVAERKVPFGWAVSYVSTESV